MSNSLSTLTKVQGGFVLGPTFVEKLLPKRLTLNPAIITMSWPTTTHLGKGGMVPRSSWRTRTDHQEGGGCGGGSGGSH